ncbi:MAG: gliding motility protein GldM [Sediminibacterium sp. Gen4]|uniref:type IX secretion system motor protein PorM/GldM n=1 Tax=unclassified Sediminibacterium TaxID=2635961 RepID=UPI0015BA5A8D|nr:MULTISPECIES: GldM family protein [unclassified Sediminibacterium]MBW0160136.1 gliding motility protein GldM [Sediminibacterium sp.]MBW0163613.1 gliding motility protein GldM [Sediminibacterium sp.]NWK66462.1 gliding motility protein GldM [Sediminibacterium sp. Gen4]
MSLPKEPRQKMINMMYLVLTALLALNVSSEILNAFKTVDRSLMTASGIVEKKNEEIFRSFQAKIEDPKTREKAEIWLPKAQKAKKISDELYAYLESLKKELKEESGLTIGEDGKESFKEDNLDAATRMFVSEPPNGKGKGKELYTRLVEYKNQLLKIDSAMTNEIGRALPLDLTVFNLDPKTAEKIAENERWKEWSYGYFHMTPTVAAITILSKFQNDVKNSESQAVEFCHKQIGQVELIYNEFKAFAGTNSQYLMPGEELIITAGMGAFSTEAKPTITIDGVNVPLNADGAAEYKTRVGNSGEGIKKIKISYTKPDNSVAVVEKEVRYTVGVPSGLVVSTDRTRVFYQGLENPLSVTGGGGGGAEKVKVDVEGAGATLTRGSSPGQYIVTCTQLGTVNVIASDGKTNQRIAIPVKRVPDPIAIVGGSAGGTMNANVFRVQRGVIADLRDFVFEGVKFEVLSYMLICTGKGFDEPEFAEVNGPSFSGDAQNLIRRCQPGTTVTIGEIKLKQPGGGTRKLDQNITFILQ